MMLNRHGLPVLHRRSRPSGQLSAALNARQEQLDKKNEYYDDLIDVQRISNNLVRERAMRAFYRHYNINQEETN